VFLERLRPNTPIRHCFSWFQLVGRKALWIASFYFTHSPSIRVRQPSWLYVREYQTFAVRGASPDSFEKTAIVIRKRANQNARDYGGIFTKRRLVNNMPSDAVRH
jgi:hypothetical protein